MGDPPQWDLGCYEPWVRRCVGLLLLPYRLNPKLNCKLDEDDLAQQVFLKAIAGLSKFRGTVEPQLCAWLRTIARNVVLDGVKAAQDSMERRADVERTSLRLDGILIANQSTPDEHVEAEEELQKLLDAVHDLPESQGKVVFAIDVLGSTTADVARVLDKSVEAVAGLLFRGRQSLRKRLGTDAAS